MRKTPNDLNTSERGKEGREGDVGKEVGMREGGEEMVLEVFYHHSKFGGARISPDAGAAKNVEFFVCLFICLFVTLLNVRVCPPDFAMKALEYRNDSDTAG